MPFYSPSTGGFFHRELHGEAMPADVVPITAKRHGKLLEQQAAGATIVAGPKGPVARFPNRDELELGAKARIRRAARRRILAIATLELQSNDNAAIATAALELQLTGAATVDFAAALDRRRLIDAVRAASNAIELELAELSAAELEAFSPVNHPLWP